MGIVDLSALTWGQFWLGALYIMSTGLLFSFGVIRLAQQHVRQGAVLLVICFVWAIVYYWLVIRPFF